MTDDTTALFALLQTHLRAEQPMDTLLPAIDRLLDAGADLQALNAAGQRPLQVACWQPSPRLLTHLIERGADVADLNGLDGQGNTPLHRALFLHREDHVQLFLRLGADPNSLNHLQQTPIGTAKREIVQLRWVQETLGGAIDKSQAAIAKFEHMVALLQEAGGKDRRADWQPLIDGDAARHVGPKDPALALSPQTLDSLAELSLWMKEHEILPKEILPTLLSEPTSKTLTKDHGVGGLAFFHHGDLHVQGHLGINSAFVVTGDLVVDGLLGDAGADSYVAVGGSLKARAINTDGEVRVAGDVVADVIYGSYNDHVLEAQTVRCKALLIDDHWFRGQLECEAIVNLREGYDPFACARIFTPSVFDVGGDLNITKLFDKLYAGEEVFADAAEETRKESAVAVLPLEQFEKRIASQQSNQRTKLALIQAHWTPSLRAADPEQVKRLLSRAIKSPKLKGELQAYLASLTSS